MDHVRADVTTEQSEGLTMRFDNTRNQLICHSTEHQQSSSSNTNQATQCLALDGIIALPEKSKSRRRICAVPHAMLARRLPLCLLTFGIRIY